jgi:hypothetical protein
VRRTIVVNLVRGLVIGVLFAIVMWLSVGFALSTGWHLLHGNSISYAGWKIPVPRGYYARQNRGVPFIWTLSLGAPVFRSQYGRLSFYSWQGPAHPFSRDKDYPGFEESVSQAAAESGHQLKSRRTISLGDKSVYCLEFARETRQPRSLVRCAVEKSIIYPFYEGDPRYLPDMFTIFQGMSPERFTDGVVTKKQ